MSRIWSKRLVVLLATACLALAAPPVHAQFAVVTVKSVDDLLDATKVILEKAGEGDKAKQLGVAKLFLGGIDTRKPIGVYVGTPADGAQPPAVAFIPVSKEDDLLDQLKQFQVDVGKPEKEVRSLTMPNGQSAFMRFANGHAYISDKSENLEGKLADPVKFLPADSKTHLIAASIRLGQLPKKMREDAVAELKQKIEADKAKKDGETPAAHEGRLFGMKLSQDFATAFMLDAEDVSLGLKIDAKTDKMAIDLSVTSARGSTLAANTRKLAALRSKFAALAADSAFNFLCDIPLSAEMRAEFGKIVEKAFREELAKETNADKKKTEEQAFKVLQECFATDTVDFGLFLTGPYADKLLGFVGGYHIKDGKKLEEQLRAVAKDPTNKDRDNIKLDVDKIGGVAVHRVIPKEKMDEQATKTFGSNEVYVCVREDAILFSVGKHGLAALRDAMGRLGKPAAGKDTDPIQMEFSFLQIAQMEDSFKRGEAEAIRKAFAGSPKGADRVRISLLGGDSLRIRAEMSLEVMKMGAALNKLKEQEQ